MSEGLSPTSVARLNDYVISPPIDDEVVLKLLESLVAEGLVAVVG